MATSSIVSVLSLITAITVAIVGFLKSGKDSAKRWQWMNDSIEHISKGVDDVKYAVQRMDAKLDKHDIEITKLEVRLDDHDRRINKLEGRCERHFGASLHDED